MLTSHPAISSRFSSNCAEHYNHICHKPSSSLASCWHHRQSFVFASSLHRYGCDTDAQIHRSTRRLCGDRSDARAERIRDAQACYQG